MNDKTMHDIEKFKEAQSRRDKIHVVVSLSVFIIAIVLITIAYAYSINWLMVVGVISIICVIATIDDPDRVVRERDFYKNMFETTERDTDKYKTD